MQLKENYFFVHNVYAHFFDDTLNYFANYLYPRFNHQVVGTYDKAVEYINKKNKYGNEHDMPNLPAIILNPSGDFQLADANSGAMQLWRFPNLSDGIPDLKGRLYDAIYRDNNVTVHPVFTRIKGEIELIMLLNSFYEYCDLRMFLFQIFGGYGRPIYPSTFRTFIIIPDELLNFQYDNEITDTHYSMDWGSCGAYDSLVKTTNRTETVVPVNITPRYTLTSLGDASMKYGGVDKLADWRLNATIEYEIEIPWYIHLKTDYLLENIDLNFTIDSYMGNTESVIKKAETLEIFKSHFDWNLEDGQHSEMNTQEEAEASKTFSVEEWMKDGFYYYTFTGEDIIKLTNLESTEGFIIPTRVNVDNRSFIVSKYGELSEKIDFEFSDINVKDTLIKILPVAEGVTVVWEENDILEIYSFARV